MSFKSVLQERAALIAGGLVFNYRAYSAIKTGSCITATGMRFDCQGNAPLTDRFVYFFRPPEFVVILTYWF